MFPGKLPPNLKIIEDFPYPIIDIPHLWIPLSDGVRLAARLWRPKEAETHPVPAILEYIPYRKTDGRRADDEQIHPYFAGHGYACLRVDIRGCGDSEGILNDEYLKLEQDDALEVIEWIANQPWCDGNVGMMGLSWGGFNALQVAALAPEPLKAIIAVGATVDRYNDDVHYKQGCMLNEHVGWGTSFTAFQSRPPDPDVVGERWREMWLERLNTLPFFAETWLSHPLRDAYWKHGSVCETYGAIKAATLIVSGWGDLYVNAVPRLDAHLTAPVASITGPWAHQFPHLATPGPAIDFLGEGVRWWDRWLKGIDDAASPEGSRAFLQKSAKPNPFAIEVPGKWIKSSTWPPLDLTRSQRLFLAQKGLANSDDPNQRSNGLIGSPVHIGTASGELIPHCLGPEMVDDQRYDDAGSLCFDTPPLPEAVDLWGEGKLRVTFISDQPSGNLIARLCDVSPDDSSERVSIGMLNLVLRDGSDQPQALPVGEAVTVEITFDHVAHRFRAGQRIRLALSTHYWPLVWPAPDQPTLQLINAQVSSLTLPTIEKDKHHQTQLDPPVAPPPCKMEIKRPPQNERRVIFDQSTRQTALEIRDDYGETLFLDSGMMNSAVKQERYTIQENDPLSATAHIEWVQRLGRGAWQVHTEVKATLTCDQSSFYLHTEAKAFEQDQLVWSRSSQFTTPRIESGLSLITWKRLS